ncbi:MAG: reverse gyrase [Zestosphaera sp.]
MSIDRELIEADLVVYGASCPNCGGFISDTRLRRGLPCRDCLPTVSEGDGDVDSVASVLRKMGRLRGLRPLYEARSEELRLSRFFRRCVGSEPWSVQNLWIRRVSKGESFAMIAPTGVGKTTFGLVTALYYAYRGRKSYIIVPTTTLVVQAERRITELLERLGGGASVLAIHSKLGRRERMERESRLRDPEGFDILITTSKYFMRNFNEVRRHNFTFVFVDDVDAVLKGSRAVNYILNLMGFTEEDIEKGLRILRLVREVGLRGGSGGALSELMRLRREVRRRRGDGKVLIIASATGNPRGDRVRLFRELMGFEIGARPELIRNVEDAYVKVGNLEEASERVVELSKKLGGGGLVFVPADLGAGFAERVAATLRANGINAEAMHSRKIDVLDHFISGEVDVLVGVATYYGVLVRGVDLPVRIRYALFIDVPRHRINLRFEGLEPADLLRLLPLLRGVVPDADSKRFIERAFLRLRRIVRRSGVLFLEDARKLIEGSKAPQTPGEALFLEAYTRVQELLRKPEVLEGLRNHPEAVVVDGGDSLHLLIPDASTYVQASGRTSRLYLGGISKGLSIVVATDMRMLNALGRRLRFLIEGFRFRSLDEVDLGRVLNEVDRTRNEILAIQKGEVPEGLKSRVEFKTALMIVESPNKAKTIARMFGRPSSREYGRLRVYEVGLGNYTLLITASGGHIYELVTDWSFCDEGVIECVYGVLRRRDSSGKPGFIPVFAPLSRCRSCGHQFVAVEARTKCPVCGSEDVLNASEIVQALRDVAYEVDEVLIGTDPDTEGEKIAYDLYHTLRPYNSNLKRIEFHEVTRNAVLNALVSPRDLDVRLVKAQLLRRVEDRWVGFSLSGMLQNEFWRDYFCKHVRSMACGGGGPPTSYRTYLTLCERFSESYRNLSAGRVQTPVLGWIINGFKDHKASKALYLVIDLEGFRVRVKIPRDLSDLISKDYVGGVVMHVKNWESRVERVNPPPPYTTDAALSEISNVLGLPATRVMEVMQGLFESGLITYHRTDSTRVSDVGMSVAKEYLSEKFGDLWINYYEGRAWGAGGAHECIRPTRPVDVEMLRELISEGLIEPPKMLRNEHFRVYEMIFKRFIASQMTPAVVSRRSVEVIVELVFKDLQRVALPTVTEDLVEGVVFDGFNRVLNVIKVRNVPPSGHYSLDTPNLKYEFKSRYEIPLHTQASIISLMKERGIGRPSTYAKILETLIKRRYAVSRGRGSLIPLRLGIEVFNYLTERYNRLVSEERTRVLEGKMRSIETNDAPYADLLLELYEELRSHNLLGVTGYEL